jgi:hypothetical protein
MNWLWDMDASHDIGGDASMDDGVLLPIIYFFVFVGSFLLLCGGVVWSLVDVPLVARNFLFSLRN